MKTLAEFLAAVPANQWQYIQQITINYLITTFPQFTWEFRIVATPIRPTLSDSGSSSLIMAFNRIGDIGGWLSLHEDNITVSIDGAVECIVSLLEPNSMERLEQLLLAKRPASWLGSNRDTD